MKKFFIVLIVLIVLFVAAVGIFIATFDANRFRPMVVEKASQALGTPVDLGKISLIWKNGLALRVQDFSIYSDSQKSFKSVSVEKADAFVRFTPLLERKIEISSIDILNPKISVSKEPSGKIGLKGVDLPSPASSAPGTAGSASGVPLLSVGSFKIKNGQVRYQDFSSNPPTDITINQLDVTVKNFSLSKPFAFEIRFALFSSTQNVDMGGRFQLPQNSSPAVLDSLSVRSDLADLNLNELSKFNPSLASAGIQPPFSGHIELKVDHAVLDPRGMESIKGSFELTDGNVRMALIPSAFQEIHASVLLNGSDVTAKNVSADFAGGKLKASGMIKQFRTDARSGFSFSASNVSLNELASKSSGPRGPKLGGRLSANFDGNSAGLSGPAVSQTLAGQGRIRLEEGILVDYNVLREVVQKISIIPGADEAIRTRLPGIYKAKMNEPSTVLKPMELPIRIQNGQVIFDRLLLETDFLSIQGAGQMGLDKSFSAKTLLLLDRDLSAALIGSVPQIQLLANAAGQIEIPVQIQGQLPQVAILPDTEYITQKVIASKAQELVTGFIQNPEQGISQVKNLLKQPVAAGESGGLQNLLGKALGQDETQKQ